MANHAIEWVKQHPTESLIGAGVIIGILYFLTRGGSSYANSAASSYYGAQAQLAGQQANYAAIQSQEQAQVQETQIAADTQNAQTLASLAAVKTQYDAAVKAAQISADVANTQTQEQGNVATAYINADRAVTEAELNAANVAQQQQYNFQTSFAKNVTTFNGSQNRLSFLQSVLGQPGAASATEYAYAGVNNPAYGPGYQTGSILSGIGNLFKGLFS